MGASLRTRILEKARFAFLVAVGLAGLAQVWIVGHDYAIPTASDSWAMRGLPAWERTALFQEDEDFAGFISFLRLQIPEDGRLILPPRRPERSLAHVGFMQYFLFPREIHTCGLNEVDDCILRVTGRKTYIISLPDFPPRDLAERSKRFVPYSGDYGVFVPK